MEQKHLNAAVCLVKEYEERSSRYANLKMEDFLKIHINCYNEKIESERAIKKEFNS